MRTIDLDFNGMDINDIDVNLKVLYYFTVVADVGNITKAAQELYVTQSMLSKNMILLEKQLGFSLFQRNSHKLSLTKEGRYLYDSWKKMIKLFRNDVQIAREKGHIGVDKIRIGCFPALDVLQFMENYTMKIQEKKPGIFVEILRMNANRLFEHLISEQADLIFVFEEDIPVESDRYEWKTIRTLPLVALVQEEDPLADEKEIPFSQLTGKNVLLNEPGGCVSRRAWFMKCCQEKGVRPKQIMIVNNDLTAQLNVRNGYGVAIGVSCVYGNAGAGLKEIPIASEGMKVAGVWLKQTSPELKKILL